MNDSLQSAREDLFLESDGKNIDSKRHHPHWFQEQEQLPVTGAPFCDFVTYTRQDLVITRVYSHTRHSGGYTVKQCVQCTEIFMCNRKR